MGGGGGGGLKKDGKIHVLNKISAEIKLNSFARNIRIISHFQKITKWLNQWMKGRLKG